MQLFSKFGLAPPGLLWLVLEAGCITKVGYFASTLTHVLASSGLKNWAIDLKSIPGTPKHFRLQNDIKKVLKKSLEIRLFIEKSHFQGLFSNFYWSMGSTGALRTTGKRNYQNRLRNVQKTHPPAPSPHVEHLLYHFHVKIDSFFSQITWIQQCKKRGKFMEKLSFSTTKTCPTSIIYTFLDSSRHFQDVCAKIFAISAQWKMTFLAISTYFMCQFWLQISLPTVLVSSI